VQRVSGGGGGGAKERRSGGGGGGGGGRFGRLDEIVSRSKAVAATVEDEAQAHPGAVRAFVTAVRNGEPLRDVNLSCQDGKKTKLYEVRVKPIKGREHVVAFATHAKQLGSKAVTFAAINTETGEVVENDQEWAMQMHEEGVSKEHAISISKNTVALLNAVAAKL